MKKNCGVLSSYRNKYVHFLLTKHMIDISHTVYIVLIVHVLSAYSIDSSCTVSLKY